jgi:hypothetical protein
MSIVKAVLTLNIAGSREGPYEMLEPDVGKLASPVLRGRGGGNIALLPGQLKPMRYRTNDGLDSFRLPSLL